MPFGVPQVRDGQDEHSGQHSKFVSVSWTNESLNQSPTPSQSGDIESEKQKKSNGNHLKHISSNIIPMQNNQLNPTAVKSKAKGKKKDIAYQKKAEELEKTDMFHFGSFRNSSQKVSNSDLKHDLDEQVKEKPPWHGG